MAQPFPFIVDELFGPERGVTLQGRSLPYRGVEWGREQRLDENWFPGNPVAQTQVIGSKLTPTTITGMWKDRFLFEDSNAATLRNFPPLTAAALPGAAVAGGRTFAAGGAIPAAAAFRARVLRDAFDQICASGMLLKVEWGSLARFGFLRKVNFSHLREEDIEFEMIFSWIGLTPAQPRLAFKPKLDALGFLARLLSFLNDILNLLLGINATIQGRIQQIVSIITSLQSFVTLMSEALQSLVSFALAPLDILNSLKGILTSIKLACLDLMNEAGQISAAYDEAIQNPIDQTSLVTFAKLVRKNASELGAESATQIEEIDAVIEDDVRAVASMPAQSTLKDISIRFYGTPDRWVDIRKRNNLRTARPRPGTLLMIPR